uniref:Uncharacterized protein n=1 Tax=Anguilla anguilla TaxID=7936 RepID=A0A0E9R3E9_ANGAN
MRTKHSKKRTGEIRILIHF